MMTVFYNQLIKFLNLIIDSGTPVVLMMLHAWCQLSCQPSNLIFVPGLLEIAQCLYNKSLSLLHIVNSIGFGPFVPQVAVLLGSASH